ncbi:hypothetical protein DFQ27_005595 [Actinomortierella ambigua]|uniref:EF-hand domain-containing protein n=1 Tax=Actinomortierella ambigua TaxID=1343610 RepID=A0A9P6UDG8_9FUNG|nr:hypothetical protein DFQ27_005595 [Actinomortierella ambigua]
MTTDSFTEQEIQDFRESFLVFDKDDSGAISKQELRSLLKTIGEKINHQELEQKFNEYDSDKSGLIDFNEFLVLIKRLMKNKIAA